MARYDVIGRGYHTYRNPDPRIEMALSQALYGCESVLNIGAGVGSYESVASEVVAVEPSLVMLKQRPHGAAPAVQAVVESLPFADNSFDASMGILTLHHWADQARGLREALRVSRKRLVFFSWVGFVNRFWLFDYFPEIETIDEEIFPSIEWMESVTGCQVQEREFLIPADCVDGFLCAWWQRPRAYLDARVRQSISIFPRLHNVEQRLAALERDLENGDWERRHGELLERETMDYGYRVLILEL